jgi:hypothetical protein
VRHALSTNKWFSKQYRTDADSKADKKDPDRRVPPPPDPSDDIGPNGKPLRVAPPDRLPGVSEGGERPLKGAYWFVPQKYYKEVKEAITKDRNRAKKLRQEQGMDADEEEEEEEDEGDEDEGRGSRVHSRPDSVLTARMHSRAESAEAVKPSTELPPPVSSSYQDQSHRYAPWYNSYPRFDSGPPYGRQYYPESAEAVRREDSYGHGNRSDNWYWSTRSRYDSDSDSKYDPTTSTGLHARHNCLDQSDLPPHSTFSPQQSRRLVSQLEVPKRSYPPQTHRGGQITSNRPATRPARISGLKRRHQLDNGDNTTNESTEASKRQRKHGGRNIGSSAE